MLHFRFFVHVMQNDKHDCKEHRYWQAESNDDYVYHVSNPNQDLKRLAFMFLYRFSSVPLAPTETVMPVLGDVQWSYADVSLGLMVGLYLIIKPILSSGIQLPWEVNR